MEKLEKKIALVIMGAFFMGAIIVLSLLAPHPVWDSSKVNYLEAARDIFFGLAGSFVLNAAAEKITRSILQEFEIRPRVGLQ